MGYQLQLEKSELFKSIFQKCPDEEKMWQAEDWMEDQHTKMDRKKPTIFNSWRTGLMMCTYQ